MLLTTLVLADDHELVRVALRAMLEKEPGFKVVGEASTGRDAIALTEKLTPTVLLLDLNMPDMSGIEATRIIVAAKSGTRILALTMHEQRPFPRIMLNAGARGFLGKSCSQQELILAIQTVARGRTYLQANLAQEMAIGGPGHGANPFELCTARELDICLGLANGMRGKALGAHLQISHKTVATYRGRLFERLGVSTEAELTRLALTHGLVPYPKDVQLDAATS